MILWEDWMKDYLDYLPGMIGGYPTNKKAQLEEIKRFCSMDIDDFSEEELPLYYLLRGKLDLLFWLNKNGHLK
jgi:hypothetical protein